MTPTEKQWKDKVTQEILDAIKRGVERFRLESHAKIDAVARQIPDEVDRTRWETGMDIPDHHAAHMARALVDQVVNSLEPGFTTTVEPEWPTKPEPSKEKKSKRAKK